jgi:hypothetical protein
MNLKQRIFRLFLSFTRILFITIVSLIILPSLVPDYSGDPTLEKGIEIRSDGHKPSPLIVPSTTENEGRWNANQTYLSKATYIAQRLAGASGNPNLNIKVIIDEKTSGGVACADKLKNTIYLSPLLLSIIKSDDELAGVMAHEVGHLLYNPISFHHLFFNNKNIPDAETQADLVGVNLLAKAGYNPNGILLSFETIYNDIDDNQDNPDDIDHPSMSKRIQLISDLISKNYPNSRQSSIIRYESLYGQTKETIKEMTEIANVLTSLRINLGNLEAKLQNPNEYYSTAQEYENSYNAYKDLITEFNDLQSKGKQVVNRYQYLIWIMSNIPTS